MKTGIELIAQERAEQIEKHGRTIELDVDYNEGGQLRTAAEHLIQSGTYNPKYANEYLLSICPEGWGQEVWLKMMYKPLKERIIIAGALLAAELDRIQNLGLDLENE